MKRFLFLCTLIFIIMACQTKYQNKKSIKKVADEYSWLFEWMTNWELTCDSIFFLPHTQPPKMLFFDNEFLYTNSKVSAHEGTPFRGPNFFGKKLDWRKSLYKDSIKLPNGKIIKAERIAKAGEIDNIYNYFVMGAPSYWKKEGENSEQLGLENHLTGIFMHEFAHTRQLKALSSKISPNIKNFEKIGFKTNFNDDVVQDYFSNDTIYIELFKREVNLFYKAAISNNIDDIKKITKQGLEMLHKRQSKYFVSHLEPLNILDNLYLTFEGFGQYAMLQWLIHPKGGGLSFKIALAGTRRNGGYWSQEEGLALFIILNKLSNPDWENDLVGEDFKDVVTLIEMALN